MTNYLNSLRVSDFVNTDSNAITALAKMYNEKLKLSHQIHTFHCGDAHRIEVLRKAVLGQSSAREALLRISTNTLSVQELYGELKAAVQLDKETKMAISIERTKINMKIKNKVDHALSTYYAG